MTREAPSICTILTQISRGSESPPGNDPVHDDHLNRHRDAACQCDAAECPMNGMRATLKSALMTRLIQAVFTTALGCCMAYRVWVSILEQPTAHQTHGIHLEGKGRGQNISIPKAPRMKRTAKIGSARTSIPMVAGMVKISTAIMESPVSADSLS